MTLWSNRAGPGAGSPVDHALRKSPLFWLGIVTAVALAARLFELDRIPLWNDELFTWFYSKSDLTFLWGQGRHLEANPPLYYTLIHAWTPLFGQSATMLRLPSVVFSLLSVVLVYVAGREIFASARAGLTAALALALSANNIYYAQEARAYAMETAAIGVAILAMARFLARPGRIAPLVLYAAGAALAVHAHLTASIFVAAANVAVFISLFGRSRLLTLKPFIAWCVANGVVLAACLPLLPMLTDPMVANDISWIQPTTRWTIEGVWTRTIVGQTALGTLLTGRIALFVLGLLLVLPIWRGGRLAVTLLIVLPLVFMAATIAASFIRPILIPRIWAWMWLPLALLLGGILARRPPILTLGIMAVLGWICTVHFALVPSLSEDWRSSIDQLQRKLGPSDIIVLSPYSAVTAFAYYAPQVHLAAKLAGDAPPTVETTLISEWGNVPKVPFDFLERAIRDRGSVWLIIRDSEQAWLRDHQSGLPAASEVIETAPGILAMHW